MSGLERREGELCLDGHPLEEAARRFGTPLYVYGRSAMEAAYQGYDQAFATVPHRICYALKANASGEVLRVFARLGAGADIVSGLELRAALRAGFPAERIIFSGVGKTDDELVLGLRHRIGEFNVESEDEMLRLSRLARSEGLPARVTLRVNPDIDPGSHPYISTGLRTSKFGIESARALEILERARRLPGIEVSGLQCHIGSQITDLSPLAEAAAELARLSRQLLDDGFELKTIDLGGGLGVDYQGDGGYGPAELAAAVLPALAGLPLVLILEPGRSLVAAAGLLLTRVLSVKRSSVKTFVVVDAGMNDLLRPALYGAFHRIEPVTTRGGVEVQVDVVGPVCESSDFLARDRALEPVEPGDLLAVRDAGAYAFVMSSNYNLRPRAAEVLVEPAGPRLIRRRETFEDLVATEVPE
jgi:diaminopimelate decarboxylase